jgi:hypothetical protein
MIDLSRNTVVRRYTKTDIQGHPNAGGGLSQAQIIRQNSQCGFEYENPEYPIIKTHDVDSVYYMQGRGPVKVGEPRITDPTPVGNTPYSHAY